MRRLIATTDEQSFTTAISDIKNRLAQMNLFKTPINENSSNDMSEYSCLLPFNDDLYQAFVITGIGRKFDDIINTVKNQYNLQLAFQLSTDNKGFIVKITNLDIE